MVETQKAAFSVKRSRLSHEWGMLCEEKFRRVEWWEVMLWVE